ncbi:ammonia-forming cytochrome c nitrite reductase subunit c552 [Campylobacter sp. VBCF_02 NA5]|uniref:ammonia-forming cytochrome c nitrite reductase subunit c552 n=1 Tax=Campylobacter sp. VBCF_02 NA5 TaxID=2983834 RepID=UPI0022E9AF03|nr:ammonia-forming cytochrome c nitrite reductase subunit c552 [Campylobacter sp. VBCF_02 NA5]MDA3061502.1 ammonia-forming cytochrome c nitrite reductase subunit c552 [Campylobacter sp. VBCF_02 NA5]
MKKLFATVFVIAALAGAGVLALFADINSKKNEDREYPLMLTKNDDTVPSIQEWGKNFPSHLDMTLKMKDINFETDWAGSLPYSKLRRFPAASVFWKGYAFAVDYNRPRLHYYSQIDQMETKRNNKEYLNSHGLPKFNGQPGYCMNCHSGHIMAMMSDPDYKELHDPATRPESFNQPMGYFDSDKENGVFKKEAWTKMNSIPYFDVVKMITKKHGEDPHGGAQLGSACADCHHPDDMSLRVTRPGFVNAMVERGYEADPKSGIKGTRVEMRNYVCMQCHVEYYPGMNSTLVFPWAKWKKDEPFKIENFDEYYDEKAANGQFKFDYKHKLTDAPIVKMQHPEAELYSTSIHARSGVTCVDCHMPYKREGAKKITNHTIQTPYADITGACKTCHMQSEQELKDRISFIQNRYAFELRKCENNLMAFIQDVVTAREELAKHEQFSGLDADAQKAAISEALKDVLAYHRKAHIRWDFGFSENSYGFHAPQEASRIVGQCQTIAREGQAALVNALAPYGITIALRQNADEIPEPEVITSHNYPTAIDPSDRLKKLDEDIKNMNFK